MKKVKKQKKQLKRKPTKKQLKVKEEVISHKSHAYQLLNVLKVLMNGEFFGDIVEIGKFFAYFESHEQWGYSTSDCVIAQVTSWSECINPSDKPDCVVFWESSKGRIQIRLRYEEAMRLVDKNHNHSDFVLHSEGDTLNNG